MVRPKGACTAPLSWNNAAPPGLFSLGGSRIDSTAVAMATTFALWVVSVAALYAQVGEEMLSPVHWKESFADSTPPVLVNGLVLATLSFVLVLKVRE